MGPDACPRCGEPGPRASVGGRCAACMGKEIVWAGARAAFRHQGVARRLVAELKFGGQPVLGRLMATLAQSAFADLACCAEGPERSVVTWVPCHRRNQRERGYNQAEVLARWLTTGAGLSARAALVCKTKSTKRQKALGREGRQENLKGAFSLEPGALARLPSRTSALILVDDVLTTGATAREVSKVLKEDTGLPVYVFTFSRAVGGTPERHD